MILVYWHTLILYILIFTGLKMSKISLSIVILCNCYDFNMIAYSTHQGSLMTISMATALYVYMNLKKMNSVGVVDYHIPGYFTVLINYLYI